MPQNYIKKILEAKVYQAAKETPLELARNLSNRYQNNVYLKREDLQEVFAFKIRGAMNKIINLSEEEKARGVITASAGNHAQGVALAAQRLGIKSLIIMPKTTPSIKVNSCKSRGAKVVLHGDTFDEAHTHARGLEKEHGYTFVHPYDDPDVIAGQGTIGMELLRQHSDPIHAVFIPVGGGGLIAGISSYIKYVRPEIKIIGVECEESACLHAALVAGRRVTLPFVGIFADGVAVAQVGKEPYRIAKECVDEVITTSTDEICAAIKDVFEDTRSICEPAGALALAGMKKYVEREQIRNENLIVIDSGANMNFDRLRHISERTQLGEGREAILAVTIPEKPGSFRKFCRALGKRNITEFNYRYTDHRDAHVYAGVQMEDREKELPQIIKTLQDKGYPVVDMTDDEMAKLHIRHMVGGLAKGIEREVLMRFEFPERPGALLQFLNGLGQKWNITLFHYRNHGAAYGRVLVGLQIDSAEVSELESYLLKLGYPFKEESDNTAYKLFLS